MRRTTVGMLWLVWPAALAAQVDVRVVGNDGPISAVRVDVWGTAELLATLTTDADGRVRVDSLQFRDSRRLSFSHLMYRTRILPSSLLEDGTVIELEARALEVEGITVLVDARSCPQPDDPEARRRWRVASSGYSSVTGYQESFARTLSAVGMVRSTELFDVPVERLQPASSWRTAATWPTEPGTYPLLEARVETDGYVWERGLTTGSRHLNWAYPTFEGRHAYHFATETFGGLHSFFLVAEDQGVSTIGFCPGPALTGLPSIRGTIVLSEVEGLLSAEWRFQSPKPDEEAGGEVLFATYVGSVGGDAHLMAARGLFYRHNGKDPPYPDLPRDYFRVIHVYTEWRVGEGEGH